MRHGFRSLKAAFLGGLFIGAGLYAPAGAQSEDIYTQRSAELSAKPHNRALRYHVARLAYARGEGTTAKRHLSSLISTARTTNELKLLKIDQTAVLQRYPWKMQGGFAFVPSTNIAKSASSEVFDTPFGRFIITDGGNEKSGLGLRIGGHAIHETALPQSGLLMRSSFGLERIEMSAQSLDRTEAKISAELRYHGLGTQSSAKLSFTRSLSDRRGREASDNDTLRLDLSHGFAQGRRSYTNIGLRIEDRSYEQSPALSGPFVKLSAARIQARTGGARRTLGIGLLHHAPRAAHLAYNGLELSAIWDRPLWGDMRWQYGADLRARRYRADFPAFGAPRRDNSRGLSLGVQGPALMGFIPRSLCRWENNRSNIALYDTKSIDCSLTFSRKF